MGRAREGRARTGVAMVIAAVTPWWVTACAGTEASTRGADPGEHLGDQAVQPEADSEAWRIVSLVPAVTGLIQALGREARLVARTADNRDPGLAHLPSVGDLTQPSAELLVAMAPDLVVVWAGADVAPFETLVSQSGGRVVRVDAERLADLVPLLGRVGVWTGSAGRADSLAHAVQEELERLRRLPRPRHPIEVAIVAWHSPPVVAGPGTLLDDLLDLAGASNVFDDAPAPWPTVGFETLVDRDPDVIVWLQHPGQPALASLIDAEWGRVTAMRTGRVILAAPQELELDLDLPRAASELRQLLLNPPSSPTHLLR